MLNRSASLAISTSVLKALPGKINIEKTRILYLYVHWIATYILAIVVPTKSDSDVIFCLQLLSKH